MGHIDGNMINVDYNSERVDADGASFSFIMRHHYGEEGQETRRAAPTDLF